MHNPADLTDNDPLILAEQCLALTSAILHISEAGTKESLQFVLHEKMEALFNKLYEVA